MKSLVAAVAIALGCSTPVLAQERTYNFVPVGVAQSTGDRYFLDLASVRLEGDFVSYTQGIVGADFTGSSKMLGNCAQQNVVVVAWVDTDLNGNVIDYSNTPSDIIQALPGTVTWGMLAAACDAAQW